jgi:hypothetical protein
MVSAGLPWFSSNGILPDVNGLDGVGDGWYTLAVGVAVLTLAVRSLVTRRPWRRLGTLVAIAGLFVLVTPTLGYSNFQLTAALVDASLGDHVAPGVGLYGTALAGLLLLVGGSFSGRASRQRVRVEPAA